MRKMPGVKSLVKISVINRTGIFPAMETQLSSVLRADRALGIPIPLRMVRAVAEKLLLESHPDLFYVDKGNVDLVPLTIWRSEALDRFVKDPSVDVGIRRFVGVGLVCAYNI